jgi:putative intracellular protease/amidase/YHS domain-containing protein
MKAIKMDIRTQLGTSSSLRAVVASTGLCILASVAIADPPVLNGLDAVALTEGKEIQGKSDFAVEHGKFRYLFVDAENKKRFEISPERFEVQKNGECAFMAGAAGEPNLWSVYQGKIYLFGSPLCRERFILSPELILHPEKRRAITKKNVAIVIFDGVELLDFAGPGEVFASAQTVDGQYGFTVYTIAAKADPVVSQGFVTIKPQYTIEDAPQADIVVIPGGDVENLIQNQAAMAWIKTANSKSEMVMSVCTGAFVLAKLQLLENKKATTHWGAIASLRRTAPTATIVDHVRVVDT